jgi:hypothetical protein
MNQQVSNAQPINFNGNFNEFDTPRTPETEGGLGEGNPHKFYNNFSKGIKC